MKVRLTLHFEVANGSEPHKELLHRMETGEFSSAGLTKHLKDEYADVFTAGDVKMSAEVEVVNAD